MSEWFKGTLLKTKVLGYLNQRRDAKQSHKWRHEKRTWMRLMTNAQVKGKMGLTIDNNTSFWSRKGMYEETSGKISAVPAIQKISISTTGTAGTMRKAEISFKVYSYNQLKAAQLAYFIPGISVIAMWGWTIKQDGGPVNTKIKSLQESSSLTEVYQKFESWVAQNDGCVDGICGLVSDFNWSKSLSGGADSQGFDCSITVESPSKGFLEQPADPPSGKLCGCPEGSEDEGDDKETAGGWVKQALKDQAESELSQDDMLGKLWKSSSGVVMGTAIEFDADYKGDDD
tara:strand:+ start:1477 stop:2334 length:858 start_codon:yes stop_codon:yes gene_type:complete